MKILYVGPVHNGSTCLQRKWALENLGHTITCVNSGPPVSCFPAFSLPWKFYKKILPEYHKFSLNRSILLAASTARPDVVWIDKGQLVMNHTLLAIQRTFPHATFVSFSPDDMLNPNNQSIDYLESIPTYHHHITTKSYNYNELLTLGAKNVIVIDNAYCEWSHRPITPTRSDRRRLGGDIGFVGYWEAEREAHMRSMAMVGKNIRIWGPWKRNRSHPKNMHIEGKALWGSDYASAISSFDINLCFLRKENRDRQTTRTLEIPACGGFMLAERTEEHQRLFQEDVEAVYFSSTEELIEKTSYYSIRTNERHKIATAGLIRCRESGYSYTARLRKIIDLIVK